MAAANSLASSERETLASLRGELSFSRVAAADAFSLSASASASSSVAIFAADAAADASKSSRVFLSAVSFASLADASSSRALSSSPRVAADAFSATASAFRADVATRSRLSFSRLLLSRSARSWISVSGSFRTSDDIGVDLKGVRSGVERRRGVSGLKARGGRGDAPGEKVLKDRRSPRERGRTGTSVR